MPVLKLSCDNVLLVVVVEEKWKQKINQKHGKNVENCVCWKNQPALFTTLTIHNDKPMIARWVPIATPAAEQTPGTWTNHERGCGECLKPKTFHFKTGFDFLNFKMIEIHAVIRKHCFNVWYVIYNILYRERNRFRIRLLCCAWKNRMCLWRKRRR